MGEKTQKAEQTRLSSKLIEIANTVKSKDKHLLISNDNVLVFLDGFVHHIWLDNPDTDECIEKAIEDLKTTFKIK